MRILALLLLLQLSESTPDTVVRRDNILKIGSGGAAVTYRSTRDCSSNPDTCNTYTYDRLLAPGRHGVSIGYYEGGDYLVVAPGIGEVVTGERPTLSPDNKLMATAMTSDAYDTAAEGLHIWDVATLLPVFAIDRERLTGLDAIPYPEDLTWHTPTCLSVSVVTAQAGDPWPRARLYLHRDERGWRLSWTRPPACG